MWYDRGREFTQNADAIGDELFRNFLCNGYALLPSAVPIKSIDMYLGAVNHRLTHRDPDLVAIYPNQMSTVPATDADFTQSSVRLLDTYTSIPEVHDLLYSESITAALFKLFKGEATCFQSLHFFVGSEQTIHQDTAYVVVKEDPLAFVGIWIALEDIQEGTGELCYYEGSHLIPQFEYGEGRVHYNHEIDSGATHAQHLEYIRARSELGGLPLRHFRPRKGDALIWHARLAHGGAPRTKAGSRKSLVGHYTPTGMTPHYFSFLPEVRQRYFGSTNRRGRFSSFHSPKEAR
jgi:phytanoyl-CoA hydroxylase